MKFGSKKNVMPQNKIKNKSSSPFWILLFLIAISYFLFFKAPEKLPSQQSIEYIKKEAELDQLLNKSVISIVGVYNSRYCVKCISYFTKYSCYIKSTPLGKIHNVSFAVIDQANFIAEKNQTNDIGYLGNSIFFITESEIIPFSNFTIMTKTYTPWRKDMLKIIEASNLFLENFFPIATKIESLSELLNHLKKHQLIVLYLGGQRPIFDMFKNIALRNPSNFFYYSHDIHLISQILIYFKGMVSDKPFYIAVLRSETALNRLDINPFVLIDFFRNEKHLEYLLKIELIPRLSFNKSPLVLAKHLKDHIPVLAYIEGHKKDPKRDHNMLILIKFLSKIKKVTCNIVVENNSDLFYEGSIYNVIHPETYDKLYFIFDTSFSTDYSIKILPFFDNFEETELEDFLSLNLLTRLLSIKDNSQYLDGQTKKEKKLMKDIILGRNIRIFKV